MISGTTKKVTKSGPADPRLNPNLKSEIRQALAKGVSELPKLRPWRWLIHQELR